MNQNFIIGASLQVRQSADKKCVLIEEISEGNEPDLHDYDMIVVYTNEIPRLILALFVLYLTNLKGTFNAS
jgi:hypothetical protein